MQSVDVGSLLKLSGSRVDDYDRLYENIIELDDTKVITFCGYAYEKQGNLTALNCAAYLAKRGKKVMYIDADFKNSALSAVCDVSKCNGFKEFLEEAAPFEDVVYTTQIQRLHMVFAGKTAFDSTGTKKLFGGRYYKAVTRQLRKLYDYVIIDCPPMGSSEDALEASKQADGVVLVVTSGKTSMSQVEEMKFVLEDRRIHVIGAILRKN